MPVDKFHHLRTLPESQAASAIAGLQTNGTNYGEATSILQDRFAEKIRSNSHMDVLLNICQVSSKDAPLLQKLFVTIEAQCEKSENSRG